MLVHDRWCGICEIATVGSSEIVEGVKQIWIVNSSSFGQFRWSFKSFLMELSILWPVKRSDS